MMVALTRDLIGKAIPSALLLHRKADHRGDSMKTCWQHCQCVGAGHDRPKMPRKTEAFLGEHPLRGISAALRLLSWSRPYTGFNLPTHFATVTFKYQIPHFTFHISHFKFQISPQKTKPPFSAQRKREVLFLTEAAQPESWSGRESRRRPPGSPPP